MDLAAQLRRAILASGKSHNALARESGVAQPLISRFANGGGLELKNAGPLCAALGLKLTGRLLREKILSITISGTNHTTPRVTAANTEGTPLWIATKRR